MQYPHPADDMFLGAQVQTDGCWVFRLWAPLADAARLLFWPKSWTHEPGVPALARLELAYSAQTGVWELLVRPADSGLVLPVYYQYEVDRAGLSLPILDPWALSADACTGKTPPRACLIEPERWQHPATPIADGGWYRHPGQAIIYEAHVRDLTIGPDSPVPGMFKGGYFGAIAALDGMVNLGITHLQLLPLQYFGHTDETLRCFEPADGQAETNYNWGYDPLSYFIPSAWFARDPSDPFSRIRDLRLLVDEAHRRGLRVILDVVYNHLDSTQAFEHLAPGYWFRQQADGSYSSNSGCGNDLESTRPMYRRLLAESLLHFLVNFDVDGFRFDLMGMIDEPTMRAAYSRCAAVKPDVLFIGEGWQLYNGPAGTLGMDQLAMAREQPLAVFNDEFRDLIKGGGMNEFALGFLHGHPVNHKTLAANLRGKPRERYTALHPWNNVNYLECHDGLTMHDNLAANLQLDTDPGHFGKAVIRRCALGNLLLAVADGIAFLQAGQEIARTKPLQKSGSGPEAIGSFVRNSYRSGDGVNALPWQLDNDRLWLRAWTRGALGLRRQHPLFRAARDGRDDRIWHFYDQGRLALLVWTLALDTRLALVAINAETQSQPLKLPANLLRSLVEAQDTGSLLCLADQTRCSAAGVESAQGYRLADGGLTLAGLSALIWEIVI